MIMKQESLPYPFLLETERLLLKSPSESDGPQLHEAIMESMEVLQKWMIWANPAQTLEESIENCKKAAEEWRTNEEYRIHFFLKDSGKFAGCSGFHRIDWKVPKFEIGYWLRQSLHGNGYVTELVNALTQYGFETLNANRIELQIHTENIPSLNVAERAGFELEGILRNYARNGRGELENYKVFSKIK